MAVVDEVAFGALAERYRHELRVHCYRMLGSFEDAEDLVQETFLRAWRNRGHFEGRSAERTWLYRIATNACLDALHRGPRRVLPPALVPPSDPNAIPRPPLSDLPFLQPYPDQLLDEVVEKETIELTFIAAIQYLPPRQRAVLILRDVLDWSANETASLLDLTVAAVKSALQRARSTLRQRLPERRIDWSRSAQSVEQDRSMLQRYMQALERLDVSGLAQLLSEDARMAMPPLAWWYEGREAIVTYSSNSWSVVSPENIRLLATSANRQPAVAYYVRELVRQPGEAEYRCVALIVLRVEGGEIAEITTFLPSALPWLVQAFGLPATL